MPILKMELIKPMVRVAKGTMIVFNSDGSFSSVLYRRGLFKKYKIVDSSLDKATIEKVSDLINDSNRNEWHYFRKQLTEIGELRLDYEVKKYMLDLYINALEKE